MNEDIKLVMGELTDQCEKSLQHLASELRKIRAGKASPAMLEGVFVDYYGGKVPLSQVANVNTPDPRTIVVKPWEKPMIGEIEKAIMYANLGLNPQNDGEQVIINVPPLTEERRLQLVKTAKGELEAGKIGLRSARKEALDTLKMLKTDGLSEDLVKSTEEEVQKVINTYTERLEKLIVDKEKEIMTI